MSNRRKLTTAAAVLTMLGSAVLGDFCMPAFGDEILLSSRLPIEKTDNEVKLIQVSDSVSVVPIPEELPKFRNPSTGTWLQLRMDNSQRLPIESISKFGQDLVVDCDGYKVVDVKSHQLHPLVIENSSRIFSIYQDRHEASAALCEEKGAVVIKYRVRSKWKTIQVPSEVSANPGNWSVAADSRLIVLLSNESCFSTTIERTDWRKVNYELQTTKPWWSKDTLRRDSVMIFGEYVLVSGFAMGICGGPGWIKKVKIEDGSSTEVCWGAFAKMKQSKSGKTWCVTSYSHLIPGFDRGYLYRYQADKFEPVVFATKGEERRNWPFGYTTFDGLYVRSENELLVSTRSYGVLSYKNRHWKQLTADWRDDGIEACGLEVDRSGTLVVPIYHRGFVFVDPKTGACEVWIPEKKDVVEADLSAAKRAVH